MSRTIRVCALALAALMVMMTLAAATLQTAVAANPATIVPSGISATPNAFKNGDKVSVTFTITDTTAGHGQNKVSNTSATSAAVESDSDFTGGTFAINPKPNNVPPSPDWTQYTVTASNLTVGKKDAAILKVKVTDSSTGYDRVVEVAVPGYSDSGSSSSTPVVPEPTPAGKTRYTVHKVSLARRVNNVDTPAETARYDITSISGSSDASIRQTYFADIVVKITNDALPDTLTLESIDKKDLGSFVYNVHSGVEFAKNPSNGYAEVKFTNLSYTGVSKTLAFRMDDGAGFATDISVDVSECVTRKEQLAENESNKDDTSTGNKLEVETPYVIVSKYGYGGGNVTAGETFNLSLTFTNTSADVDVTNMMITMKMPDDLMLTSSSNTFYVSELKTKASITKSVQVTAKPAAKAQSHNIETSMKYQYIDERNSTRKDAATSEQMAIPVVQIDRFQMTAVEIPTEMMMDEETSIMVSFVNKGRSEVYNLTAAIDGNMQNPGQQQNLGNLLSGATGTADFFIKPSETGTLAGMITITYEDTNMEEKVATIEYNSTVMSMDDMNGGNMGEVVPGMGEGEMPVPEEKKPQWPVYVIIAVVVLVPAAVIVKKKLDKKRKEQEDADL